MPHCSCVLLSCSIPQVFSRAMLSLPVAAGVIQGAIDYYISAPLQRHKTKAFGKVWYGAAHLLSQLCRTPALPLLCSRTPPSITDFQLSIA